MTAPRKPEPMTPDEIVKRLRICAHHGTAIAAHQAPEYAHAVEGRIEWIAADALDACRAKLAEAERERDEADHDAGLSGTLARHLLDQNKALVSDLERAINDEQAEVRRGLWLMHGHHGLCGDDGEMRCDECGADYKRDPLEDVFRKAWNHRHDDFGKQMRAVESERDALRAEVEALASALERTRSRFVMSVQGKPVRDMDETLAECDAALRAASEKGDRRG